MTKEEPKTTLNFPLEEAKIELPNSNSIVEDEQEMPKKLPNKKQVRLLFPYAERQEAKKLGAKWNSVEKYWYYPSIDGDLPDDLLKYKSHDIHIEYDDKEFWKQKLSSIKWDANRKVWMVREEDYHVFTSI